MRNSIKLLVLIFLIFLILLIPLLGVSQSAFFAGATGGMVGPGDSLFFYKEVLTLTGGAGDTVYFMFTTPDTDQEIRANVLFAGASAEFDVYIFSAPTTTADGTPVVFTNANGNSDNTPILDAFAGPTVTDEGDRFWHAKVGVGKSAGVRNGLNYEIIAKRNTKYLFKIVKIGTTSEWLDIDFFYNQSTP